MKIEMKYNVGDIVWIPCKTFMLLDAKPRKGIVFKTNRYKRTYIVDVENYGQTTIIDSICFPTIEECQAECDRLNGEEE